MGSLDDSGNVRHHETAVVAVRHHSEVGPEGGEWVIRDFRLGRTHDTQQGRFACIRKSDQTHIREEFEFEDAPEFFAVFPWLRVAGRLVCRRLEMIIAPATPATRHHDPLLPVLRNLADNLLGLSIPHDRANGHVQHLITAICAVLSVAASWVTVTGQHVFPVLQVQQRPMLSIPA